MGPISFSHQVLRPFPLSEELSCATPLAALPGKCSWVSKDFRQAKEALLFLQMKIGHVLITAAVEWWLHQVYYYSLYFSAYLKFSIIKSFLNYKEDTCPQENAKESTLFWEWECMQLGKLIQVCRLGCFLVRDRKVLSTYVHWTNQCSLLSSKTCQGCPLHTNCS